MRTLPLNSYDLVYIDGSHVASDVLEDAVLAWQLVKVAVSSFWWLPSRLPSLGIRIGIDAFMRFSDKFKVIHKDYQVIIEQFNKSGRWTKFIEQLPDLYQNWSQDSVVPNNQFQQVLEQVRAWHSKRDAIAPSL